MIVSASAAVEPVLKRVLLLLALELRVLRCKCRIYIRLNSLHPTLSYYVGLLGLRFKFIVRVRVGLLWLRFRVSVTQPCRIMQDGSTALFDAVTGGHVRVVKTLIDHCINVDKGLNEVCG